MNIRLSKRLSRVLRHDPGSIGLQLDEAGWADIDALLERLRHHNVPISRRELDEVVATNDKRRFTIDGERIRANQGHSVKVELGLDAVTPPAVLYHGTPQRNTGPITSGGLLRMNRHHVHLSADVPTAVRVGSRRGVPVVFAVDAGSMHRHGHTFHRSANGVWLTDTVPARYLEPIDHA